MPAPPWQTRQCLCSSNAILAFVRLCRAIVEELLRHAKASAVAEGAFATRCTDAAAALLEHHSVGLVGVLLRLREYHARNGARPRHAELLLGAGLHFRAYREHSDEPSAGAAGGLVAASAASKRLPVVLAVRGACDYLLDGWQPFLHNADAATDSKEAAAEAGLEAGPEAGLHSKGAGAGAGPAAQASTADTARPYELPLALAAACGGPKPPPSHILPSARLDHGGASFFLCGCLPHPWFVSCTHPQSSTLFYPTTPTPRFICRSTVRFESTEYRGPAPPPHVVREQIYNPGAGAGGRMSTGVYSMATGTADTDGVDISHHLVKGPSGMITLRADTFLANVTRSVDSILYDLEDFRGDARVEVCYRIPPLAPGQSLAGVLGSLVAASVADVLVERLSAREPGPVATYVALNVLARSAVAVAAADAVAHASDPSTFLQLLRLLAEVSAYFTRFGSGAGVMRDRRLFAPGWATLAGRCVQAHVATHACLDYPLLCACLVLLPLCRHIIGSLPVEVLGRLGFETGASPDSVIRQAFKRGCFPLPLRPKMPSKQALPSGPPQRPFHPRMIYACRKCKRVFPHVDEAVRRDALHEHVARCGSGAPLTADDPVFRQHYRDELFRGLTQRQAAAFVDGARVRSAAAAGIVPPQFAPACQPRGAPNVWHHAGRRFSHAYWRGRCATVPYHRSACQHLVRIHLSPPCAMLLQGLESRTSDSSLHCTRR